MILSTSTVQIDSFDVLPILLTLIPVIGTIFIAFLGFIINKRMEITKETNSRKRQIYEEFLNAVSLTQFGENLYLLIDPSSSYPFKEAHTAKLDLIKKYESVKLWGSQGVVEACFGFFNTQVQFVKNPESVTQNEMKRHYYKIIEEMRIDLKMDRFFICEHNIQNVTFDRNDGLVIDDSIRERNSQ